MSYGSDTPGGRADFGRDPHAGKGRGDVRDGNGAGGERREMPKPAPEVDYAALREAERLRKKRKRFQDHRERVNATREELHEIDDLDDFEQGQVNKSLTSMRKYRDQTGAAKWDIQEVLQDPKKGLRRIAAIREGLFDDEETGRAYEAALRKELGAGKFDFSLLDITNPKNKKRKYRGDLEQGFRFVAAAL